MGEKPANYAVGICQRTGFKVKAENLSEEWTGLMTRIAPHAGRHGHQGAHQIGWHGGPADGQALRLGAHREGVVADFYLEVGRHDGDS